tara:strand:+ start:73 stop:291 length:219 start_codon:yes stop_codon:yes gene_type:complete
MRNNAVQFIENFGAVEDWKDMTMGDFVKSDIPDLIITDLDMAIKIVRASGLKQIQLRQDDKVNGGTFEWDNF